VGDDERQQMHSGGGVGGVVQPPGASQAR